MLDRRDLLLGVLCAGALGAAEALRPRRLVRLLAPGKHLTDVVPTAIPGWSAAAGGDIVVPRTEGSLAARLYADELARYYQPAGAQPDQSPIMLLIAYGSSQSDSLQLHRPEACYPASGFTVTPIRAVNLSVGKDRVVPAVALTATLDTRVEDIIYFTRLGDALPRSEREQRRDRLRAAMAGMVNDGLLLRASAVRGDSGANRFAEIANFLSVLLRSVTPAQRTVLLGTSFAVLN
jgi:EpsI family protein